MFLMSLISSKKWTKEFYFTTMIPQVDLFSFVFWRKYKTPKNHFEITWPLESGEPWCDMLMPRVEHTLRYYGILVHDPNLMILYSFLFVTVTNKTTALFDFQKVAKSGIMSYIHIFHFGIDFRSCVILVNNFAVNIFL